MGGEIIKMTGFWGDWESKVEVVSMVVSSQKLVRSIAGWECSLWSLHVLHMWVLPR